jgi:hypothetical protein
MMTIKKWFKQWSERPTRSHKSTERAHFTLCHHGVPIGDLCLEQGKWKFAYSDEFRASGKLRPLFEFPDVDKVYESSDLWSTFETRIPSTKQPRVREILDAERIDEGSDVELLRRFGRQTVSSPFELVESK